MRQIHDETRGSLREYLSGDLEQETIEKISAHLQECSECRDELAVISDLMKVEVPDPGDLFWNTLPKKIRITAGDEKVGRFSFKKLFFSPLPFASAVMILVLLIFANMSNKDISEEPFIEDPLSVLTIDYSDLKEEDIPTLGNIILLDENYSSYEDISGNSYHREVASLDARELEVFYDVLKNEGVQGG